MPRPGKKAQIIEAAIAILSEKGASGLTTAALADRAGVSKANLFHHFESLDDIVVAALEQFLLSMPAMAPAPGTPLRAWLLALGRQTSALMEARRTEAGAYLAFMSRAQSDPRLRKRLEEVLEAACSAFARALRTLAPGRWSSREADHFAYLLVLAGDGLALHRQLFPDHAARQDAAWRTLVDRLAPKEVAR